MYFEIDKLEPELKLYLFCLYCLAELKDGVRTLSSDFNVTEHLNISKYKTTKFNSALKEQEILTKACQIKDDQVETIYILNLDKLNEK